MMFPFIKRVAYDPSLFSAKFTEELHQDLQIVFEELFFFCGALREGENGIISAAVKIDVVLPVTSLQHPASKRFVTHSPPLSRVISAPQKMGAQFVPLRVGFSFSVLPQECYTNNGPAKVNAKSPPFSKTVN